MVLINLVVIVQTGRYVRSNSIGCTRSGLFSEFNCPGNISLS